MSIGIALLGAGVLRQKRTTEHLPVIQASPLLTLKAIYSRSQISAENFIAAASSNAEAYFDSPSIPSKSLDSLLQRDDIAAVIVCVAINVSPEVIKKALHAGKHVLKIKDVFWGVAENFRFWNSVHEAAKIIKELDANLVTFSITCYSFVNADNPFYHSDWRQKPTFQGGYLLDGGVHFVAVLRTLLASLGRNIETVSAYTTSLQETLPPVDTVHAIIKTDNARVGTFISSVGIKSKLGMDFEIVTDKGSVRYSPFQMQIATKLKNQEGKWEEQSQTAPLTWGVKEDVAAFAEGISTGRLDSRLSASEALEDLKIVEGMLASGDSHGLPINVTKDIV